MKIFSDLFAAGREQYSLYPMSKNIDLKIFFYKTTLNIHIKCVQTVALCLEKSKLRERI